MQRVTKQTQHEVVLAKLRNQLAADDNVVGLLVFGSVADGTYRENSDIDLSVVYKEVQPGFEFSTEIVDGVKVGFSRWSLEALQRRVATTPYRLYVFAHATALIDRAEISQMQQQLKHYFATHPVVTQRWVEDNEKYRQQKQQFGQGQSNIFAFYKQLDAEFGAEQSD